MSHIMYVGPVGSGKTFNAIAEAIQDTGDFIVTNTPVSASEAHKWVMDHKKYRERLATRADGPHDLHPKQIVEWKDFADKEVETARCGAFIIDEAPLWLDARKYDSLSPEARRKIIEHRKDDLAIISTAQDVAFIDKVFRLLCDEIRLVKMVRLPLIGWFWPTSVRPTIICRDCGRVRRDGAGDDRGVWSWFGFGTLYSWTSFKAKDLIDAQDTTGETIEPKSIGGGFRLFDIRIASAYSTSMKLSAAAAAALASRRYSGRGRERGDRPDRPATEPAKLF